MNAKDNLVAWVFSGAFCLVTIVATVLWIIAAFDAKELRASLLTCESRPPKTIPCPKCVSAEEPEQQAPTFKIGQEIEVPPIELWARAIRDNEGARHPGETCLIDNFGVLVILKDFGDEFAARYVRMIESCGGTECCDKAIVVVLKEDYTEAVESAHENRKWIDKMTRILGLEGTP